MKTFVVLPYLMKRQLPIQFQSDDNRYPEVLVEYFLNQYTKRGDKVLDIFAGFGTTLLVAEEMCRIPFGIEYDKRRFEYVQSLLRSKECLIHGDALNLESCDIHDIDFAMSSPPFMNKDDAQFALTAYTTLGTYQAYLDGLEEIYGKMKKVLKPNAYVVIEAANLKRDLITTLAWDIARSVSRVLSFQGEIVICWEGDDSKNGVYSYGYDHSYCLVFKNEP
jgi:SAM-dependent methyltransferase